MLKIGVGAVMQPFFCLTNAKDIFLSYASLLSSLISTWFSFNWICNVCVYRLEAAFNDHTSSAFDWLAHQKFVSPHIQLRFTCATKRISIEFCKRVKHDWQRASFQLLQQYGSEAIIATQNSVEWYVSADFDINEMSIKTLYKNKWLCERDVVTYIELHALEACPGD